MSELNLLIECINTEGEAEDGGIKYIYMDADTIYRFENNRMKKISKTLINKARKQIQSQNTINQLQSNSNILEEQKIKPTKSKKSKKSNSPPIVEPTNDDSDNDDDDSDDEEPEPEPVKRSKKSAKQPKSKRLTSDFSPNINLDEYYNNKNKMEYMNLEITRLNNKVDKLKQYKAIVNKLTGNEFDFDVPQQSSQQASQQQYVQDVGRSAWQSSNQPVRNDSLFLY